MIDKIIVCLFTIFVVLDKGLNYEIKVICILILLVASLLTDIKEKIK